MSGRAAQGAPHWQEGTQHHGLCSSASGLRFSCPGGKDRGRTLRFKVSIHNKVLPRRRKGELDSSGNQ